MMMKCIRPACGRGGRYLRCLLLVLLTAAVWMCAGSGAAEAPVMNASGNVNLQPAVDPLEDSEGCLAVLYDNRNGLPTSEANAIAQTPEGFLWIGSYAGLIRYDGSSFERIQTDAGILNTRCLFVDSRGRLWIGTNDSGIFLMSEGVIRRVDRENLLASISIRAITEDRGVMYIATAAGIATVDGDMNLTVLEDSRTAGKIIIDLRMGDDGLIYGLTIAGDLFTLRDRKVLSFVDHTSSPYGSIFAVLPDPEQPGKLYFATDRVHRVCRATLKGDTLSVEKTWYVAPLVSVERLESIGGKIWICAGNGIGRLSGGRFRMLHNAPMEKLVGHVMTDHEGNLWFTSTRQCVMKIVPNRFLDLFGAYGLPEEIVNTTCLYDGRLFVGTDSGLIVLENGKRVESLPLTDAVTAFGEQLGASDLLTWLKGMRIRSIVRDSRNRLWICVWDRLGLLRYDGRKVMAFTAADGLVSEQVRTVRERDDGSFLVAQPGGVSVIRGDRVSEEKYTTEDGMVVTNILTLSEGPNGEAIFGTDGGGIYVAEPDGLRHVGLAGGLQSEIILRIKRSRLRDDIYWIAAGNSIAFMTLPNYKVTTVRNFPYPNNADLYEDSSGGVWVLSGNGIYTVSADELLTNGEINAVYYGIPSGLPYVATSNSFSELTPEGDLYVAGVKGVIRFNIEEPAARMGELKVSLPFIDVDGVRCFPNEKGEFHLPGTAQKLTIHPFVFTYSLVDPEIIYRLDGFDTTDTVTSREKLSALDYTNLRIGAYSFVMTVRDPVGGDEQTVSFRIVKGREFPLGMLGTVALLFVSILMMSGILAYSAPSRKRSRADDKLFFGMIIANIVLAVCEQVPGMLESTPDSFTRWLVILGMLVCHAAAVLFPYLTLLFIDTCAGPEHAHTRRVRLLFGIPCFLCFGLLIVNIWNGWVFSIDEGSPLLNEGGGILRGVPMALIALYTLLSLIRGWRVDLRIVFIGLILTAGWAVLELLFSSISSTSFIYTLVLMCFHIRMTGRPVKEVTP